MNQDQVVSELLQFMGRGDGSDGAFDEQALRLFAYQFENSAPFRRFCQQRRRTPRTVRSWRDIPAVPINAFKDLTLSCVAAEAAARVFMTSGTTRGGVRGKSYHPTLEVYDASMQRNFGARFMQGRDRIRIGILFPDSNAMPNSSLAHYLDLALTHFGADGSCNLYPGGTLDLALAMSHLEEAEASGAPYALLGASFSFVHLLDEMGRQGRRFALPPGSRLLDTGGFKGQSRELELDEFYDQLAAGFGVARSDCFNMYGMTELSTQFYDDGNTTCPSVKSGPHWIRTRAVDPLSGIDVPPGETGVLVHCDLAHFNIVTAILTEDAGTIVDGGFVLHGRASGAEAKGCSLAVEEFLQAAGR
ncbi:MAG: long-chain fatty acid--CoA ligase [Pseudomonadota bacterium]